MNKIVALIASALFMFSMFFAQQGTKTEQVSLMASNAASEIPSWIVEKFQSWKSEHSKQYNSIEVELYRMAIYYSNFIYIQIENAQQSDYELGENQFMDLSQEEFAATYLTVFPEGYEYPEQDNEEYIPPNAAKNWVAEGKVGPIENQGSCGSCWAFSAAETVQSYWALNKGSLPSLSEQQLVDCSRSYGNQGCNGGWPSWALNYVKANGLTTQQAYPYTGRDGTCKINTGAYKIPNWRQNGGCSSLTTDINLQPTSVCVDATNWSFYRSGIFSNCAKNINHAVLAVGWDDAGNWLIQNSWGTSWGAKGFITLKNGDTCAVCQINVNVI